MSVSQAAISQKVGVSRSAVSHVLNGRGHMVSASTRGKIMDALEAAGYHRNALVRSLKANRTHVVGIIVPEIISLFAEIIRAVEEKAKVHNMQCFIYQSHSLTEVVKKAVRTLREYRVDGLLILPTEGKDIRLICQTLLDQKFPVVVLDAPIPGLDVPYVGNDNRQIGRLATQHLLEQGHRRIAFVRGDLANDNAPQRFEGYRQALKEAGVAFDPALVTGNSWAFEEGKLAVDHFARAKTDYTALIASSDFTALGVMQALTDYGLHVPDDVALIGCGNLDVSAMVSPSLTTLDQNPRAMGDRAMDILISQIEGQRENTTSIISSELVVRQSSGRRVKV